MLKNYFKIALRNIRRQPVYSAINIVGLGVGMACCLLILIFVLNEYGVNRNFEDKESIYRVNSVWHEQGDDVRFLSFSPLAAALETEFAGVEEAIRYTAIDADISVANTPFRSGVIIADPAFFDLFSFQFIAGNATSALRDPDTVVITESEAIKLFGTTDAVGEVIQFSTWTGQGAKDFRVTGVIAQPAYNSVTFIGQNENHIIIPFSNALDFFIGAAFDENWGIYNTITYARLAEGVQPEGIEAQFPGLLERNLPDALRGNVSLQMEPLEDVYLNDFGGGARKLARLLLILAGLIMGIACFNYINVSTALAVSRAREVGMRKVLGASRVQLVRQYLGESILICALGMMIALALAWLGVDPFSGLVERAMNFDFLSGSLWLVAVGIVLVVGVIGGVYPALYLAGVRPSHSLKALSRSGKASNQIRRTLVGVQFTIATALFISAVVVNRQASHIAEQDVGFDKDQVLVVSSLPREWTDEGVDKLDVIKRTVQELPGIDQVSIAWGPPGPRHTGETGDFYAEGATQPIPVPISHVDAGYLDVLGLELREGAFFDPLQEDNELVVVLNEAAVRAFGWSDPIGQFITRDSVQYKVLGVVQDFHAVGLEHAIEPLALVDIRQINLYREMLIRFPGNDPSQHLEAIQSAWAGVYPELAFEYYFLDQQWHELHQWIWRTRTISLFATLLAIFIACLGLFGVVSINVGHRTKEIGIRKVIGASVPSLLQLLSVDFLRLIFIAFAVASPLAYFTMNAWLEGFASRVDVGLDTFVGAGLLILLIAGITISAQSIRAALMNPIDSLRHE